MKHYLLDTDTVINYLTGISSTVELIRNLHQQGKTLCTSAVVIAQVSAALHPDDRAVATRLLSSLTFLPTSPDAAWQAGECRYDAARRGMMLPISECLIVATAVAHGATLVTGNPTNYPREELTILPLPRPEEKGGQAA